MVWYSHLFKNFQVYCDTHRALDPHRAQILIAHLVKNPPAMQETRLIPGLRRSAGEGIGYPHQYSWAFLVAQMVKNLPAVQET